MNSTMMYKAISFISVVLLMQVRTVVIGCNVTLGTISCTCKNDTMFCSGLQTENSDLISAIVNTSIAHYSSVHLKHVVINVENLSLSFGSSLEELELQNLTLNSGLTTLPDSLFSGVTESLISLDLRNNSFTNVPENALKDLHQLENLDLSDNLIIMLTKNNFDGLKNLTFLKLERNSIFDIEGEAFSSLENLEYLSLEANEIQKLGITVFDNLRNLKFLSLASNQLQLIEPETFMELPVLQKLILDHNSLLSLKNIDFSSVSLLELSAINCSFEGSIVHDHLQHLSGLEVLDLSFNNLSKIETFALTSLQHLKLLNASHNRMRKLEGHSFANLVSLKELDLSHNVLFIISSDAFRNLTKLVSLNLSHNKLGGFVCKYTSDLLALEQINLQSNELQTIKAGTFFHSLQMKNIKLQGNTLNCDCMLAEFAQYLRKSPTINKTDIDSITCSSPPSFAGMAIAHINYHAWNCTTSTICSSPALAAMEADASTLETPVTTLIMKINTLTTSMTTENVSDFISAAVTSPMTIDASTDDSRMTNNSILSSVPMTTSSVTTAINTLETIIGTNMSLVATPTTISTIATTSSSKILIPTTSSEYLNDSVSTTELLTTLDAKDDMEIVIKTHSYGDGNLCLEWLVNGTFPSQKLRCILLYRYPTPNPPSPAHSISQKQIDYKCPTMSNEIRNECKGIFKVDKLHQLCMKIYKSRKLLVDSCIIPNEKPSTDNSSLAVTKMSAFSPLYNDTNSPSLTITSTTPVINSLPIVTTTTINMSNEAEPALNPVKITYMNISLGNDSVFKVNWEVNRKELQSVCNLVLQTFPESAHHESWSKSDMPCMDNTEIIPRLEKGGSYKVCLIVVQSKYNNITFCSTAHIPSQEDNVHAHSETTTSAPATANFTTSTTTSAPAIANFTTNTTTSALATANFTTNTTTSAPATANFTTNTTTATIITSLHIDTTTAILNTTNDAELALNPFNIFNISFGVQNNETNKLIDGQATKQAGHSESEFWSLPMIVLIALLVAVILVVIFLATRTILRKPAVSETYNVTEEENRVHRRENQLSNTQSMRYSYTPRETLETFKV